MRCGLQDPGHGHVLGGAAHRPHLGRDPEEVVPVQVHVGVGQHAHQRAQSGDKEAGEEEARHGWEPPVEGGRAPGVRGGLVGGRGWVTLANSTHSTCACERRGSFNVAMRTHH